MQNGEILKKLRKQSLTQIQRKYINSNAFCIERTHFKCFSRHYTKFIKMLFNSSYRPKKVKTTVYSPKK